MKENPVDHETEQCTVIVFPLRWRKGKARHVAETFLATKPGKRRTGYWNRIVTGIERQLERTGLDEEGIARELHEFTAAVQAEIDRMRGVAPKPEPDGAA